MITLFNLIAPVFLLLQTAQPELISQYFGSPNSMAIVKVYYSDPYVVIAGVAEGKHVIRYYRVGFDRLELAFEIPTGDLNPKILTFNSIDTHENIAVVLYKTDTHFYYFIIDHENDGSVVDHGELSEIFMDYFTGDITLNPPYFYYVDFNQEKRFWYFYHATLSGTYQLSTLFKHEIPADLQLIDYAPIDDGILFLDSRNTRFNDVEDNSYGIVYGEIDINNALQLEETRFFGEENNNITSIVTNDRHVFLLDKNNISLNQDEGEILITDWSNPKRPEIVSQVKDENGDEPKNIIANHGSDLMVYETISGENKSIHIMERVGNRYIHRSAFDLEIGSVILKDSILLHDRIQGDPLSLKMYSLTNPKRPQEISVSVPIQPALKAYETVGVGETVYVESGGQLIAFDISDPNQPSEILNTPIPGISFPQLFINDNWLQTYRYDNLQLFQLNNEGRIRKQIEIPIPFHPDTFVRFGKSIWKDDLFILDAFISDSDYFGQRVWLFKRTENEIRDTPLSSITMDFNAKDLHVENDYLFAFSGEFDYQTKTITRTLDIYSIENPNRPMFIKQMIIANLNKHSDFSNTFFDITSRDDLIIYTDPIQTGIINIRNPETPVQWETSLLPGTDLYWFEDLLVVYNDGNQDVIMYELNRNSATEVKRFKFPKAVHLTVNGTLLYSANGANGFEIFDLTREPTTIENWKYLQ